MARKGLNTSQQSVSYVLPAAVPADAATRGNAPNSQRALIRPNNKFRDLFGSNEIKNRSRNKSSTFAYRQAIVATAPYDWFPIQHALDFAIS